MTLDEHIAVPDAAGHLLSSEIARVFVVANNPAISLQVFDRLSLAASDLLVQFNRPLHVSRFSQVLCHKLYFHNRNHRGSCWGFDANGLPEYDLATQRWRSLTFATTDFVPPAIEQYLTHMHAHIYSLAITSHDIALYCYPAQRLPSAGFTAVAFLRTINWVRQRLSHNAFEITTIGFTGVYPPGKAWCGHDFRFEQFTYRSWLDICMLDARGVRFNDWHTPDDGSFSTKSESSSKDASGFGRGDFEQIDRGL